MKQLQASEDISAEEAEILLNARAATRKVIMVDDFSPESLTLKAKTNNNAPIKKKAAGRKKAVNSKSSVKKASKKST